MPVGYGAQCSACNSKRRKEIDGRLLAGESSRAVTAWLASVGEQIGKSALARHKAEHLDVIDEARAQLSAREAKKVVEVVKKPDGRGASKAKRKAAVAAGDGLAAVAPLYDQAVAKVIADVDLLDQIASVCMHVGTALVPSMTRPTQAQATAFGDAMRHARGAAMDRHEILHGKKVQVDGNAGGAALAELLAAAKAASEANASDEPKGD